MSLDEIAASWKIIAGIVSGIFAGVGSVIGWIWMRTDSKEVAAARRDADFWARSQDFQNRIDQELSRVTESNRQTVALLKQCQIDCTARDNDIAILKHQLRAKTHEVESLNRRISHLESEHDPD